MKNENFAERLFCDLRNAEIKIEKPFYSEGGGRIGENNTKQFNIVGIRDLYSINEGPACQLDCKLTFTEAYQILLDKVIKMKEIKFYSLATPQKGPESARLEEFEKVVTRYIKDYLHETDDVMERWDILVQQTYVKKINKFKHNDVVVLNSGGQPMIVLKYIEDAIVKVAWLSEDNTFEYLTADEACFSKYPLLNYDASLINRI